MRTYLGVDGGGSKTAFVLIDWQGTVLASHAEGPAYHLEIGFDALRSMIARGVRATLERGGVASADLAYAFLGLPAYGEDSRLLPELDSIAAPTLSPDRFRCGNDMICGWAGALAGQDGINVVAGTGSIAYGAFEGRTARAGGWGELFGDEGSAFWIAREGLALFSRMSDGRLPRSALYRIVRKHFGVQHDLDVCAAIHGQNAAQRSQFAQLSRLVTQAAGDGDLLATALLARAADELGDSIDAVRRQLEVPGSLALPLSYSGGLFESADWILKPLRAALEARRTAYRLVEPQLPPAAGAALYAATLGGMPLGPAAVDALARNVRAPAAA